MPASFFSRIAAGGVLVMKVNDLSEKMVISTGRMVPASFWVRALNSFTNAMMLMPCGPNAVPTGGAGVACPAGICNFTNPATFFAIVPHFWFVPCAPLRARTPTVALRRSGRRRRVASGACRVARHASPITRHALVRSQLQIIQLHRCRSSEQADRYANLAFVRHHLFHRSIEIG